MMFCNTCNTFTEHLLRARYSTDRIQSWDDDAPVRYAHRFSLWSCEGCKEATLEKQWASEDSDSEWVDASGEYYPKRLKHSIQPKVFPNLNDKLSVLYKEIVTCFNEDCLLVCTIGLRALVEGICVERGLTDEITGRDLGVKIDGLNKLLPSLNLIGALHAFKVTGNEAAHRLEALNRDDLRRGIEVMEHLLNHFYEVDFKASQVRNPKKVALDN
jgi:hypothetical protein